MKGLLVALFIARIYHLPCGDITVEFFNKTSNGDFIGSYAVVHFSIKTATKLRERVKLIDQSDWLPPRPTFEKTVELKDGVGSDIQLFGYHGQKTKNTAWRFFRQELFLDDDTTPFLILHWRHTVDEITLIDVIQVK